MKLISTVKSMSSVALMLAFFMPLSQCSIRSDKISDKPPETKIFVKYAYSRDSNSLLILLANIGAFFWPVLASVILFYKSAVNLSLITKLLEIFLCFGTGYMLVVLNIFGEPLYGSYVAAVAIVVYFHLALYEGVKLVRGKIYNRSLD